MVLLVLCFGLFGQSVVTAAKSVAAKGSSIVDAAGILTPGMVSTINDMLKGVSVKVTVVTSQGDSIFFGGDTYRERLKAYSDKDRPDGNAFVIVSRSVSPALRSKLNEEEQKFAFVYCVSVGVNPRTQSLEVNTGTIPALEIGNSPEDIFGGIISQLSRVPKTADDLNKKQVAVDSKTDPSVAKKVLAVEADHKPPPTVETPGFAIGMANMVNFALENPVYSVGGTLVALCFLIFMLKKSSPKETSAATKKEPIPVTHFSPEGARVSPTVSVGALNPPTRWTTKMPREIPGTG